MEVMSLYIIKVNILIIIFYITYHFMVSKETFFSSNRWFLLSGLATAVILPLLFIPKYIIVQPHITEKSTISQTVEYTTNNYSKSASLVDWNIIILSIYLIVFLILFSKLIISFFSLYKLLHRHKNIKRGLFKLVDLDDEIAPFSFFNYIVYNSNFYTEEELQSILLHEKVHSEDKHSIDTLISQLFCIVFWFNPFIWLYKKSVLQNLEYIADQKASKFLKDKTQYQKALLKVITERNCFSISNHFNSSLIKNRIIMLNQPQSEKKKTWKYALIIPVLAGFMFFFQTKTIAQEKNITQSNSSDLYITTDKNSSEQEIKEDIKIAKEKFGVVLKYSKIKRNTKGEITAIKIEYKDFEGKKGMTHIQGDDPIKPIYFHKTKNRVGFGKANEINSSKNLHKSNNENNSFGFSFLDPENDIIHESEEIISTPKNPDASNKLEKKEADKSSLKNYNKSIIIKKQNNGKPEIIINGKTIETDSEEYKKALKDFNGNFEFNMQEDGPMVLKFNNEDIFKFDSNEIEKITKDALSNSQKQFSKLREKINSMRPKMDQMKVEIEKIKPEDFNFDFNWNEKENDSEIKKAKEEMLKAREEMIKAREEMIKAKEEMLKAKNQQNKTKKA
ncbi:BlaR1 peptidase M56 [Flavobacterium columnare]|uniref:BlaR1 peptidase M56 n=3 Tax=Flavobacterium TaxID=237 RepID=A0A2N9PEE6_9FLAO|nr:BlaR1 peptidase M56 [Flavobacterium columnare]